MSKDPSLADLAQLRFRHPDYLQAGSLHNQVDFWEDIISSKSIGYIWCALVPCNITWKRLETAFNERLLGTKGV